MNNLFLDEFGRVRSGLRAAVFIVSFLLVSAPLIFAGVTLLAQLPLAQSAGGTLPLIIPFGISTGVRCFWGGFLAVLMKMFRFGPLAPLFTRGWLRHLLSGLAIGSIALSTAVVLGVASGGLVLSINRSAAPGAILTSLGTLLVVFAFGAASEETLFRGYLLQTFARSGLFWIGAVLTSSPFALGHNNNPSVGALAIVNTLLAGIWFALAYWRTRDLWFPFGIHLAWNWLQGPVFGINVSGISEFSPDPVLRTQDLGPVWLTGGAYGIEGGIACTAALALGIAAVLFLPRIDPAEELVAFSAPPDVITSLPGS